MSGTYVGTIYKGIGGLYFVKPDDLSNLPPSGERFVACKARGKFRAEGITPTVGDRCEVQPRPDGGGYLLRILPRLSLFERPAVANITRMIIVASAAPPATDLFLIDRMAALAAQKNVEAVIAVNKTDLDPGEEIARVYEQSGFRVLRLSAETGKGTDLLRDLLSIGITAFSGQTGVGKSSLLNRVFPEAAAATGEISVKLGRGRHTTRAVEIFDLPNGGAVVDTPGFSSFDDGEADQIPADELPNCFVEFREYLGQCRFSDCSHCKDQGCAILEALDEGKIQPSRHRSYVRMYDKAKLIKPWDKK